MAVEHSPVNKGFLVLADVNCLNFGIFSIFLLIIEQKAQKGHPFYEITIHQKRQPHRFYITTSIFPQISRPMQQLARATAFSPILFHSP